MTVLLTVVDPLAGFAVSAWESPSVPLNVQPLLPFWFQYSTVALSCRTVIGAVLAPAKVSVGGASTVNVAGTVDTPVQDSE